MVHRSDYRDVTIVGKLSGGKVMSKYINLVGNPISGFRVFGPYDDIQEASDAQDGIDEYAIAMEVENEVLHLWRRH